NGAADTGFFTYRDLATLRDSANYLSLWRSQLLLTTFSRSLARLTHRSAVTDRKQAVDAIESGGPASVPIDARPARATVLETLRSVYEMTRSHSATVRLVTADQRRLARFAAFPPDRQDDPHDEIDITNFSSVNAWVARFGRVCYLANLGADKPFAGY